MKIVLVEDDTLLARHYQRVLKAAHYDVWHAEHAIAAIDSIDKIKPDVIVADMLLTASTIMPLLHELRSHDDLAKIPVIVITNIAETISLETLQPYGAVRLLDKTVMQPDDLIASIKSVTA